MHPIKTSGCLLPASPDYVIFPLNHFSKNLESRLDHYLTQPNIMKIVCILTGISVILIISDIVNAGQPNQHHGRLIFCMIPLEHANAEQLVDVLTPFLSPQGKITAYTPTNTLIIKDHPIVVKMLVKAIKGKPDLSECLNLEHAQ